MNVVEVKAALTLRPQDRSLGGFPLRRGKDWASLLRQDGFNGSDDPVNADQVHAAWQFIRDFRTTDRPGAVSLAIGQGEMSVLPTMAAAYLIFRGEEYVAWIAFPNRRFARSPDDNGLPGPARLGRNRGGGSRLHTSMHPQKSRR